MAAYVRKSYNNIILQGRQFSNSYRGRVEDMMAPKLNPSRYEI